MTFETLITILTIDNLCNLAIKSDTGVQWLDSIHNSCDVWTRIWLTSDLQEGTSKVAQSPSFKLLREERRQSCPGLSSTMVSFPCTFKSECRRLSSLRFPVILKEVIAGIFCMTTNWAPNAWLLRWDRVGKDLPTHCATTIKEHWGRLMTISQTIMTTFPSLPD